MAVTLKDIAERTGVSTTTVSRILNGREGGVPIREDTKQKVLAIAAEMGYMPNLMARALRGNRTSLIGVMVQNINSLFHRQILQGLHEVAVQRGYRMFLGNVQRAADVAIDLGSVFEHYHADGIVVVGEWRGDQEALDILTRRHRHIIGVSDRVSRRSFPGVYSDNHVGTKLALDHLWAMGHRRIACVADINLQDSSLRSELFKRFSVEHNAERDMRLYLTERTFAGSYETGRELFSAPELPTAIFATTDVIAIGLLQAAFQLGIAVPKQVSIMGYDDLDIAAFTIPPLTTVRQLGTEMGKSAAGMLLDMIEQDQQGDEVDDVVLTPTLVVRQSTAPPVN